MCGIAGYYGINDKALIKSMIAKLQSRGPDNVGIAERDFATIASARLSIIDVEGGNQPIWNKDETVGIVANCEIYNYKSIRIELINLGYEFKTQSDVEVILHGYEEWGYNITRKIEGIFAVAIIDTRSKELILIRDRLGIKPLYYCNFDGKLFFGSEAKAILEYEEIPRILDSYALQSMLQLGYVTQEQSLFSHIKQLLPGNYLTFNLNGISIKRYWDLPKLDVNAKLDLEILDRLVDESVKRQLMSERPVGLFVSGGLDSSLVAYYAAKHSENISAFTQSFGEIDESPFATKVCETLGIEQHIIEHTPEDEIKLAKELVYAMEHPTFRLSYNYTLAKFARSRGKVVLLSGLGGDELFGGYMWHSRANKYGGSPNLRGVSKVASGALEKLNLQKLAIRTSRMSGDSLSKLIGLKFPFSKDETSKILNPENNVAKMKWDNVLRFEENKSFFRVVETDLIYNQLEGNYLKIADRMSMKASIELRVPLLDEILVEYAMKLPVDYKINNGVSKFALRKLAENKLPNHIIKRGENASMKGGYGFGAMDFWKRGIKDYVYDKLSSTMVKEYGVFNINWIDKELPKASKYAKIRVLWTMALTHDLMDVFDLSTNRKKIKISS